MKCPVCTFQTSKDPLEARVALLESLLLESLLLEGLENAIDIEAPDDSWLGRCRKAMEAKS